LSYKKGAETLKNQKGIPCGENTLFLEGGFEGGPGKKSGAPAIGTHERSKCAQKRGVYLLKELSVRTGGVSIVGGRKGGDLLREGDQGGFKEKGP